MACYYFVGSCDFPKWNQKKYYTVSSILVPNFDIIRLAEIIGTTVVISTDTGTVPVKLMTIHPTEEDANNKIEELITIDRNNLQPMSNDDEWFDTNEQITTLTKKVSEMEKEIKRLNELVFNLTTDIQLLKLNSNGTDDSQYVFIPNSELKFLRNCINKTLNDIKTCEAEWEEAQKKFRMKLENKTIPVSSKGPRLSTIPIENLLKSYSLWPRENKNVPLTWTVIPKPLRENISKTVLFLAESSVPEGPYRSEQINKRTRDWVEGIQEKFRSRKKYISKKNGYYDSTGENSNNTMPY